MNMEYSTKFSDFKPEELVGKWVLLRMGMSFSEQKSRYLKQITKVWS